MATVYVNDQPVDIGDEKLNLIQAALGIGVFIPYYCWHPALTVVASCRMCLVEIGEAWVAMADSDAGFARRLRKAAGADLTASGATRVSGSLNFKVRSAHLPTRFVIREFPLLVHWHQPSAMSSFRRIGALGGDAQRMQFRPKRGAGDA